jgi:sporadic carbohydrate cluster 2OG-Fe(II) oxygenase
MIFFKKEENKIINKFLKNGYYIGKVEDKKSLDYINKCIKRNITKKKTFNFNTFHKYNKVKDLNKIRVKILNNLNKNRLIRNKYFNLAREHLYALVGNELMMQKRLNLSIQIPNDSSSLLPIHSDVWSGDSPYEINLWVPLVNCFKTKSMYILNQKKLDYFLKKIRKKNIKSSKQIFNIIKDKVEWISIKYGEFLIFNQTLPHGNIINLENETRWSLNCRFKNIFSPYEDKKIGEFFLPITTRPMTKIGINYKYPFA